MNRIPLDRKENPNACDCEFTPYPDNDPDKDESFHFLRECPHCKHQWYSLSCPHETAIWCPSCKGLVPMLQDEDLGDAMSEKPKNWVRLACGECDREDYDRITEEELAALKDWEDISEYQTWKQSIEVFDNPNDSPNGYSALDWYTHLGLCPECKEELMGPVAYNALMYPYPC